MKKTAVLIAAALIFCMIFAGCDSTAGTSSEDAAGETAASSEASQETQEAPPQATVIQPEAPEEEEIAVTVAQSGNDAKIQAAKEGGEVTVGLSVPSLEDPYYSQVRDGVQAQCDQYGYRLSVLDAEGSSDQQAKDFETFINEDVTAVIATPINQSALEEVTARMNQAGIVLVSFGTQSQNLDAPQFSGKQVPNANSVYVLREYDYGTAIGNSAVNWIQSRLSDMGNVLILTNDSNLQSYTRANGIMDAIMSTSMDSFIVGRETAEDRESGKEATAKALEEMPSINVIVATTDAAALGAQDAVREADLPQESLDVFYIGGAGGSTDATADMESEGSLIRATASLAPNTVGANCVNAIHTIIEGGTMPVEDQVVIAYWNATPITQTSSAETASAAPAEEQTEEQRAAEGETPETAAGEPAELPDQGGASEGETPSEEAALPDANQGGAEEPAPAE